MTNLTNSPDSYAVVIPAAGIGSRFKSDIPKQYTVVNGKTILEQTLDCFLAHSCISYIVVALHEEDDCWASLAIDDPRIVTVRGGPSRADSVLNSLRYLQQKITGQQWVLVHDACRPYLSATVLERLIVTVKSDTVGGILAIPSTDTLKKVVDGRIVETLPRESIWRAQTPQMFRLEVLAEAIETALMAGQVITDEASAIEQLGMQPLVVAGDVKNIKITVQEDLNA